MGSPQTAPDPSNLRRLLRLRPGTSILSIGCRGLSHRKCPCFVLFEWLTPYLVTHFIHLPTPTPAPPPGSQTSRLGSHREQRLQRLQRGHAAYDFVVVGPRELQASFDHPSRSLVSRLSSVVTMRPVFHSATLAGFRRAPPLFFLLSGRSALTLYALWDEAPSVGSRNKDVVLAFQYDAHASPRHHCHWQLAHTSSNYTSITRPVQDDWNLANQAVIDQ